MNTNTCGKSLDRLHNLIPVFNSNPATSSKRFVIYENMKKLNQRPPPETLHPFVHSQDLILHYISRHQKVLMGLGLEESLES